MGPSAFARRLPGAVGTERGKRLVNEAIAAVEVTGKPDGWIREVQRARDEGALTPAVVRFLIFTFAESAITALLDTHPRLARIIARLERIEREHGLKEGEYWHVDEGPPEVLALNREFDQVADEIMAETFLRHSELELARNPQVEGDALFSEGAALVFPPDLDAPSPSE
jgi:hypothetical protein